MLARGPFPRCRWQWRTGSQLVDGIFCGQFIVGGFVSIRKQMAQVYEDPGACIGFNLRDAAANLMGAVKGDFHILNIIG